MKKYGKKWRKLEAEKKIERERIQAKAGEPFSSVRKKKILCAHYVKRQSVGYLSSHKKWYSSLLEPISTEECMCSTCKKRFPIEKCAQMEKLLNYLSKISNSEHIREEVCFKRFSKLSQGLEPVYYRRLSETEIEILDTVEINEAGCRLRIPLISYSGLFREEGYCDIFICKRHTPPHLARTQAGGTEKIQ